MSLITSIAINGTIVIYNLLNSIDNQYSKNLLTFVKYRISKLLWQNDAVLYLTYIHD